GMRSVRGFFQGNQSMEPTAVSQIIEQVIRIALVLLSAFVIVKSYDSSIVVAVCYATCAAFVGARSSCVVLLLFWLKRKQRFKQRVALQSKTVHISTMDLIKELLSYAGPFVLVGIAIPLIQLVDSFTFNKAMEEIGE